MTHKGKKHGKIYSFRNFPKHQPGLRRSAVAVWKQFTKAQEARMTAFRKVVKRFREGREGHA